MRELPRLRAFALTLTSGLLDRAEDLVQDVVEKALRHRDKYVRQTGVPLRAWLFTILRNTWFAQHRRVRRMVMLSEEDHARLDDAVVVPPSQEDHVALLDLMRAAGRMSEEQTKCLRLLAGGDSYEEVATRLGVPEGTVKSRVSRAREMLGRAA